MNTPEKKRNNLKHSFAQIHPSRVELALMLVLHCAAILAVLTAALPFIIKQLLVVSLALVMAYRCHQWRLTPTKRWVCQNDRYYLSSLSSKNQKEAIVTCYYWSRFCVVLIAEGATFWNKPYRLIFWDACSAEDFRHIKLVSRYQLQSQ